LGNGASHVAASVDISQHAPHVDNENCKPQVGIRNRGVDTHHLGTSSINMKSIYAVRSKMVQMKRTHAYQHSAFSQQQLL
jgi:hypothetical protein